MRSKLNRKTDFLGSMSSYTSQYKQSKNFLNTSKTILTKASTTYDDTNRNKTVEAPSDNYLYKGFSVFKIKTNVLKHVLAAAWKPTLPSF